MSQRDVFGVVVFAVVLVALITALWGSREAVREAIVEGWRDSSW